MGSAENFDFEQFMKGVKADATLDKAIEPGAGEGLVLASVDDLMDEFGVWKTNPDTVNAENLKDEMGAKVAELMEQQRFIVEPTQKESLSTSIAKLNQALNELSPTIH